MEPKLKKKKIHAFASLRPPVPGKHLFLMHLSMEAQSSFYFPDGILSSSYSMAAATSLPISTIPFPVGFSAPIWHHKLLWHKPPVYFPVSITSLSITVENHSTLIINATLLLCFPVSQQ